MSVIDRFARNSALAVLSALVYYVCAGLSYELAIRPANVVVIWFPSGVILGALGLLKPRQWPAVLAGGVAGNVAADMLRGLSFQLSLAGSVANGLESLAAATVLVRFVGTPATLATLRHAAIVLIGSACVSNAATALIGARVIAAQTSLDYWTAWFVWWTGDGMGMLVMAPVILSLAAVITREAVIATRRAIEGAMVLIVLAHLSRLVLSRVPDPTATFAPEPYMLIPFLLWLAVRVGLPGATLGTLVLCLVTVGEAAHGSGPFAHSAQSATGEVLRIYVYLALASLSALVPAAILTERRQEETLRARLAAILDAAPDIVTIGQIEGPPLYLNPAARRAFGLGEAERVPSLLAFRRPGFDDALENLVLPAAIRDGSWHGESEYLSRDGRVIPVSQVSIVHRDAQGRVAFLSTISRDISERRRMEDALRAAEERMRFALEVAGAGIWEFNMTTGVVHWSPVCERMHGLAAGTFGGTFDAFLACIAPDERDRVAGEINRTTRGSAEFELDYRTIWADGTERIIATTGRTVRDESGRSLRSAGVVHDVTEQRTLEAQLRQAQKMEAIGQLAGGVAHDFNNILTVIIGSAELTLSDLPAGHRLRPEIEEIRNEGKRAAEVTSQLLAFSRRQILEPRVLRIGDAVSHVVPLLRRLIGEAIDLRTVIGDRWRAKADPGQIEQVILNLAVNARDAMPQGGRLTIETSDVTLDEQSVRRHPIMTPGPYVVLAVSDTGHGMDAATRNRIFEPFFTTKAKGQGTGLGLATVYGIVKQSGGHIWVYSEPGHGTAFKVYLPRTEDKEAAAETRAGVAVPGGDETILLVEDEAGLRRLVEKILTRSGYQVLSADRPSAALRIAETHDRAVHLVLTDVVMPEMNGRDLAARIQHRHPEAQVLYMSGYTEEGIVHHGMLDAGMAFLQKPFAADALLGKVRAVFDRVEA